MVIWSEFRMEQSIDYDHREDALHCTFFREYTWHENAVNIAFLTTGWGYSCSWMKKALDQSKVSKQFSEALYKVKDMEQKTSFISEGWKYNIL